MEEDCFIMSWRVEGGVAVVGGEGVEGTPLQVGVLLLLLLEATTSSDEMLPLAKEDREL